MANSTCVFCEIIKGTSPATIRYQNDEFIAFDNLYPQAPIHILIIPKQHFSTLEDVPKTDTAFHAKFLQTAREVAHQLGIQENYKLHLNVGLEAQLIAHIHFHLYGGWKDAAAQANDPLK